MWIILNYRSVIEVQGRDRLSFLQGLITQDVEKLTKEMALYSLFLNNTGRFFSDFFLVSKGDSVFLTPGQDVGDALCKKLLFYKLRSEVEIKMQLEWVVAVSLEKEFFCPKKGIVFSDPRSEELGTVFIGPKEELKKGTENTIEYENKRFSCGIPEGPLDLEVDKSIPLENWMDELKAISWDKGCFLGQELTSRTKHIGTVRKKAVSFLSSSPLSKGDVLIDEQGTELGKVMSTYQEDTKGFALVNLEQIPKSKTVLCKNKEDAFIRLNLPVFRLY